MATRTICSLYRFWGVAACLTAMGTSAVLCAQEQKPEKTANPITRWFQQFDREIKGQPLPVDTDRAGRDQFDSRTPQQPEASRRLTEAELAVRERRWEEAVQLLQFLIEREEDSLIQRSDGEWESLHEAAEKLLRSAPEEVQRAYATRFEMVAQSRLESALQGQNETALVEIVRRYFHTAAGRRALEQLAIIWRDRGELTAAARAYQKLADSSDNQTEQNRLHWLAAESLALSGNPQLAKELASRLSAPEWFNVPQKPSESAASESGATSPLTDPLLLPKWSVPVTFRYRIGEQIRSLWADLEEQGKAPIPAQSPLLVGELIAMRTLHGIEVRRRDTGELAWAAEPPESPEDLLGTESELDEPWREDERIDPYDPGSGDSHQLASILYRDTVYGSLTTDGRQLFSIDQERVLERQRPGYYWQSRFNDESDERPIANSIVAYDLETGLIRWRVGGPDLELRFSRPLSGTYFFGPPTVAGDDLFAIGERKGDVFLHCLSARTGEVLWSQIIATAGRPIAEDFVRRWWWCAPVISEGLVICPTTTGWLVAVDRNLQQLRWVYRYMLRTETGQRFRGGYNMHSIQDLNVRWQSTPPLVADGKLVLAPPELPDEFGGTQPLMACLDLRTGRELWRRPKGEIEGISVEGVWRDVVLVLTSHSLEGLELNSGQNSWEISFPAGSAAPCGRGVLTGNDYLVPLADKSLIRVELDKRQVRQLSVPEPTPELGSLAVDAGTLYSLSPLALSAFPPKPDRQELAAAATSTNPAARVRRAEVLAAEGKLQPALQALADHVVRQAMQESPQLAQRVRQLEWRWRAGLFVKDMSDPAGELDRLSQLAETPQQHQFVGRARADHLQALGDRQAALDAYFDLLAGSRFVRVQDGTRDIRLDRWIAGRLQSLLASASPSERKRLDARLDELVTRRVDAEPESLQLLAGVLRFHPLSQKLHFKLGVRQEDAGQLTLAAVVFSIAAEGADGETAAKAQQRFESLRSRLAEEMEIATAPPIPQGEVETEAARPTQDSSSDSRPTAPIKAYEVVRTTDTERRIDLQEVYRTGEPLWNERPWRYLYEMESSRLCVEDLDSGGLVWSAPLQSLVLMEYHGPASIHQQGAITYVMHQGVVHAFSMGEHRRLWTFQPQAAGETSRQLRAPVRPVNYELLNPQGFLANSRLGTRPRPHGYFQDAGNDAVLVFAESLIVLDPVTGEVLWRDAGISKTAMAWVIGETVLIVSSGEPAQLRRLSDGAPIEHPGLEQACRDAVAVVGNQLVSLEEQRLRGGQKAWTLRARSLPDFTEAWSVPLAAQTELAWLDQNRYCVLSPDRTLSLLNLETGESQVLGRLPEALKHRPGGLKAASDGRQIYVIADIGGSGASYIGVASVRANGKVLAYDAQDGLPLWELDTSLLEPSAKSESGGRRPRRNALPEQDAGMIPLSLSLQEFEHCPLLVFLGDQPVNQDDLYFRRLRIVCVDKQTSEIVLDWVRPSDSGGFSQLHYDPLHSTIELRTYNERLQIRPVRAQDSVRTGRSQPHPPPAPN